MSQNVQFEQVVIDGVIVEVSGHDVRIHIVGRMLYRRKGIDIFPHRQNHDPARVLSRAAPNPGASLNDPVDFAHPLLLAPLFEIVLHIAEGRLVRQRADGAGAERLPCAENHFCIFMGLTLVFP